MYFSICLKFYNYVFYLEKYLFIVKVLKNTFTIVQNNTCLKVLIKIYNNLENALNKKDIGKIEIFINILTKHLLKYLEIFSFADSTNNYNEKF